MHIKHFLLVFDHTKGELRELIPFESDAEGALAAYSAKEREFERSPDRIEVVLIGSDSLETVKQTHANYFEGEATVSHWFDLARTA